jgi:hypothetical protein
VKAFERAPHQWLVAQGTRFRYPMMILRLSIKAYRLERTLCIDGLCSKLLVANRGITAGAVHATTELRLLPYNGWMKRRDYTCILLLLYMLMTRRLRLPGR